MQVLYGFLLVAHSLGSRGNTPDGEDGPQWRGRQPWGHHLLQSLPCTGQSHCHTQGRWSLLHTWRVWLRELGAGAPWGWKRTVSHLSGNRGRQSSWLWGFVLEGTDTGLASLFLEAASHALLQLVSTKLCCHRHMYGMYISVLTPENVTGFRDSSSQRSTEFRMRL